MTKSADIFNNACEVLVGGVNSPVRAFNGVGGVPVVFASASGARLTDVDGREFIDFVLSWGPLILGHAPERVRSALEETLSGGWSFGAPVEAEGALAREVLARHPGLDKIRFVSSGTEATMSALRLARGVTGRDKIVKFAGGYHGHADSLLVAAGSGLATLGTPSSAGVPAAVANDTIVLPYNDPAALIAAFETHAGRIAAVIVEPVAGNMGVVPPGPAFVEALNTFPSGNGALLILDEVMTGFRVGPGSARQAFGFRDDIVTFGKVVGGGMPVGAYAARSEIMDHVAPLGPVYQAGTLSGNPLAMVAGLETIRALDDGVYADFERRGSGIEQGLAAMFAKHGVPACVHRAGSMLGVFLCEGPVTDFASADTTDTGLYSRWFHAALDEGVYLAPSAYEALFLSTAHDDGVCEQALAALDRALVTALERG